MRCLQMAGASVARLATAVSMDRSACREGLRPQRGEHGLAFESG